MENKLLAAALWYARHDWYIFPLKPRSKEPLPGTHGVKDATNDEKQIRAWWAEHPDANIGGACGPSKITVIDVDGDKGGTDSWAELRASYTIDDKTPTSLTASGEHLIYRNPPGVSTRNTTGKLGAGLDTRGDGGYIVLPPSIHPSGIEYRWEETYRPNERAMLPLPPVLVSLLNKPSRNGYAPPHDDADTVPEGGRNAFLTSWAGRLRRGGANEDEIAVTLRALNTNRCQPPLSDGEVEGIAASVARYRPEDPVQANGASAPAQSFNLTDLGNAERLAAAHGKNLRYCHTWASWLIWDDTRWQKDDTGAINRLAKNVVRSIYAEARDCPDDSRRKELAKHAIKSEAGSRVEAMVSLARHETGIPIRPDELDADAWLLNCQNGVVNLHTGDLLPHDRAHYITRLCPVAYDPLADCPLWHECLHRIMESNQRVIDFLQRYVGYSLTGNASEQSIIILYGSGSNGKTTFMETIQAMLGDYAMTTPTETLMVKRPGGIPNDVARLRGARLITANEAEEGQRLAESLLKQLTGKDTVSARFMHGEFFDFQVTGKIWLRTNHKPIIRGTDKAIWRRIRLIPFDVTISDTERDTHLAEKLQSELPGILAWAVRGCIDWQKDGMGMPDEVRQATTAYRNEMDVVGDFLAEKCVVLTTAEVRAGTLYKAYKAWCDETGNQAMTSTAFGRHMTERGYDKYRASEGMHYLGIGLSV